VSGGLLAFDIVNPNLRELLRPETQSVRLDVGPNPCAAWPSRKSPHMIRCSRSGLRSGAFSTTALVAGFGAQIGFDGVV
jgi:hypothetical protein